MNNAGRFFFGAGLGCAGIIGLLIIAGIAMIVAMPSAEVTPGKAIPDDYVTELRKLEILGANETPIYFYTSGVMGPEEGGSFFSEERVVAYQQGDASETLEQAAWTEIANVDVTYSDNWLDDTLVTITRTDKTEFVLTVSNTDHGDRRFYNRLVKEWRAKTGRGPAQAAEKIEDE